MTKDQLRELRHPIEGSRFALTLFIVVPAILLALVATFQTFGVLLFALAGILLSVWFVTKLVIARFLGNAVRVSEDNFPEILAAVNDCKALFGYEPQVDVFVYEQGSFNAMVIPLLQRKVILLNADTVSNATPTEIRWLVARFVGSLASKHYRFLLLQVVLASIEKLAVFNVLLYPYERAVIHSGDQLGLVAIDGDLESAVSASHKFLAGGSLGGGIDVKGILKQDKDIQGSFFGWLVKCLSPFPHLTARVTNLLRFAAERYPARFNAFLARRDEATAQLVREAIGRLPEARPMENPEQWEAPLATG